MSFLKKEGQRVWVPAVISKIWIPGRWEEKKIKESVYVPGDNGSDSSGDRHVYIEGDFGFGRDGFGELIVDY